MRQFALYIFLILFLGCLSRSYAQNFVWARNAIKKKDLGFSPDTKVARDGLDYQYTAGTFVGNFSIGSSNFNTTSNYPDIYLAKYSPKGDLVWAIRDGGSDIEELADVCYDGMGSLYIVGTFEGTSIFGTTTLIADDGIFSSFIAKYDTAGNFIWARSINAHFGFPSTDVQIRSVSTDDIGNIIIGGLKYGTYTIYFDTIPVSNWGGFTAKYDALGNALWVSLGICGYGVDVSDAVADHLGNIYTIGTFDFSSGVPGAVIDFDSLSLSSYGGSDIFILKYDSAGNALWARDIYNGTYNDVGKALAVDSTNNIYVTGAIWWPFSAGFINHSIVSKYDIAGTNIWQTMIHGAWISAIAVDKTGNSYITGRVEMNSAIGTDTVSFDQGGSYVAKLDLSGSVIWSVSSDSTGKDLSTDITINSNGSLCVSGKYIEAASLGHDLLMGPEFGYCGFTALLNDTSFVPPYNNIITGNIFNDSIVNCIHDTSENNLSGYAVIAQPGNYYALTDVNGDYKLHTGSGVYSVEQILPLSHSEIANQTCPIIGGYLVNAISSGTVYPNNDFANDVLGCPLVDLDMDITGFAECGAVRSLTLRATNYGSVSLSSPTLTVVFSSSIVPLSSTPAWTSYIPTDTTLIFNLPSIAPGGFSEVIIEDSMACIAGPAAFELEYNHYAAITPVINCDPGDEHFTQDTISEVYYWPVGITSFQDRTFFNVFPNPSNGTLYLKYNSKIEGKFILIDVLGNIVREHLLPSNSNATLTFEEGDLNNGIYFYEMINSGQQRYCGKIIIVK